MSGIKVTAADKAFALCVKKRANWRCEMCGTGYGGPARGLECSHYVGRANHSTRFEPLNATALCTACHMRMGGNPHQHGVFQKLRLGPTNYDVLIEKSQNIDIGRQVRRDMKAVAAHFKAEFERMDLGGQFTGYL